ncbi:hypothetical protein ABZ901_10760 [Actinacidiphila alni]|uniref:hypothetical protein n=1 Tax=Actinacidiphila alni TaxID=380248 RepID=UPI0033E4DEA3
MFRWWVVALGLVFVAGMFLGGGWTWGLVAVCALGGVAVLGRHRYALGSARVLRAHVREHGDGAAGLGIRWVRIVAVAGLDERWRRQSDCSFDTIDGVPLTLFARLARRRLVVVGEDTTLTLWHRRMGRYREAARLRPRRLRVLHDDVDLLRQSRSFLAERPHRPVREFSPYSMIADFGNRKTISFHVTYGPAGALIRGARPRATGRGRAGPPPSGRDR